MLGSERAPHWPIASFGLSSRRPRQPKYPARLYPPSRRPITIVMNGCFRMNPQPATGPPGPGNGHASSTFVGDPQQQAVRSPTSATAVANHVPEALSISVRCANGSKAAPEKKRKKEKKAEQVINDVGHRTSGRVVVPSTDVIVRPWETMSAPSRVILDVRKGGKGKTRRQADSLV